MDIVYFLKHSSANDLEILISLRSVAKHFSDVGKVWIVGDRPTFLTDDTTIVEHIPHDYLAAPIRFQTPIVNQFQLLFASSLLPELTHEFLYFCDDYVLLDRLTLEEARKSYYLEDMDKITKRGRGIWMESLWRTYEQLKRLGYPRFNFETHCPAYFRRKWVFDAYVDLKDFVTNDRYFGLLAETAILNHAIAKQGVKPVSIRDERLRIGFWGKHPQYDSIQAQCRGKRFLNFDDAGFGPDLKRYLLEMFSEPCRYEKDGASANHMNGLAASLGCFQVTA
ncbi:hypothetical protein LOC69_19810 [Blastopirellula sp. JC733]|nr:hypothetical protein [Blastopirellula sediminis]